VADEEERRERVDDMTGPHFKERVQSKLHHQSSERPIEVAAGCCCCCQRGAAVRDERTFRLFPLFSSRTRTELWEEESASASDDGNGGDRKDDKIVWEVRLTKRFVIWTDVVHALLLGAGLFVADFCGSGQCKGSGDDTTSSSPITEGETAPSLPPSQQPTSQPRPTLRPTMFQPTTMLPPTLPKQAFWSTRELYDAVDAYGHPMNTWNVSRLANFAAVFLVRWHNGAARSFNEDPGDWNMPSAQNLSGMFWDADAFNGDISGWDTSSVVDLK
jgi:hypothetical protein